MRLAVKLRSVGLASIGWGTPWTNGADIAAFRRPIKSEEGIRYEIIIPGSSFKGALRSAAHRVAKACGFNSCIGGRDGRRTCPVCAFFGFSGSSTPSAVRVSDFMPESEVKTIIMNRIRIEDSSMKVSEGGLFSEEYLLPGVVFSGVLEFFGTAIDQKSMGLLLLSLAELRTGRLGRRSLFDLKVEEDEEIRSLISGSEWLELFEDLRRWLWREVL